MPRILLIFSVLLVIGCSPKQHQFSPNEIYGRYIARYYNGVDVLDIYKDHTYRHEYYLNNNKEINVNTWELSNTKVYPGKSTYYFFSGFIFREKDNNVATSKTGWSVFPEKSGRISFTGNKLAEVRMRLCFNYDMDYCFVKVD